MGDANPNTGDGQSQGGQQQQQQSGGGDLGWRAQLKEDLKSDSFFTKFDSVTSLGKYAMEADGKLSKALFIPGEGATEEEKGAFYGKLGRPETPDKYGFTKPDGLPENLPYDSKMEAGYKDMAHKLGLSESQAKTLYSWYLGNYSDTMKADLERREKSLITGKEAIAKEWGDKFDENSKVTMRAVEQFGGPEFKKYMDESGLGNHPVLVKTFFNIGQAMLEDKFAEGGRSTSKREEGKLHYPSMQKK